LNALQAAALARVDVRVMMPLKSDSLLLTYASYSYIMEWLRAGIKIYLFEAGMLHSKTMIIDDRISAIGSANIDFRSFEHNFEDTMFVYSCEINADLRRQFMEDQQGCVRVRPSQWRHRPVAQKALESVLRLLSPVL
ncbi:MAG: cardiolipin synthase, partial [Paramuribaculum sp.]|nr:cardiolipin synthase [Paramuribaculum sp.]